MISDLEFLRHMDRIKVLLVDDQANMIRTMENMLSAICTFKRKRDNVFKARNGTDALSVIFRQTDDPNTQLDLVLLDWNMPQTPGIEVLRTVRRAEEPYIRDVPIIMVTGEAHKEDVVNAIYEGANAYLLKPFLVKDLRERMNPILRNKWSGLEISRAQNRRSEVRWGMREVPLNIRVELSDGTKKYGVVKNLSSGGLRVDMGEQEEADVVPLDEMQNGGNSSDIQDAVSIYFPDRAKPDDAINKIEVKTVAKGIDNDEKHLFFSLHFHSGIQNDEISAKWNDWIETAKERELAYRANW
ncbi:MAG: response regulator [Nitrospinota bacterium]|nr:response regulator [Nitrospinota bacterium]